MTSPQSSRIIRSAFLAQRRREGAFWGQPYRFHLGLFGVTGGGWFRCQTNLFSLIPLKNSTKHDSHDTYLNLTIIFSNDGSSWDTLGVDFPFFVVSGAIVELWESVPCLWRLAHYWLSLPRTGTSLKGKCDFISSWKLHYAQVWDL